MATGMDESWESLLDGYYKYLRLEKNLSPHSVEAYMRDIGQFRTFLLQESRAPDVSADVTDKEGSSGGPEPGTDTVPHPYRITVRDIEAFMASLYVRGASRNSQARALSGVKSFFHFLAVTERIGELPTEFVEGPKARRKLPEVLTVGEIDAILGAIDVSHPLGHRNRAMLETLYSCGLRVSELTSLRISDLFFDEGFIRVTGKGNKQRLIPVSDEARKNILLYLEQRALMPVHPASEDILFLNQRGRGLTRVMVFTIIRQAAAQARIDKTISPHTFRHSFATHLLQGGASIRQVQEMLGHESILTTEIYTHLDTAHLRESVETHHPLGNRFEE